MTCSQRNQKTFSLQAVSIFWLKGLAPFCFSLGNTYFFSVLTFHQLRQLIIPRSFLLGATGSKEYSVYLMLSSFPLWIFFLLCYSSLLSALTHAFVSFFLRYKNLKALILASSLHFDQLIKGEVFCPNYVPLGSLSILFMQILPKLFIIQATYKYLFMVSL